MKKNKDIFKAFYNNNLNDIKSYIAKGIDINKKDEDGNTPLMIASENGNINIVRLLLQNDADVNIINNNGKSALIIACTQRYYEYSRSKKRDVEYRNFELTVSLLLERGADIFIKDKYDKNALDYADDIILKILLRSLLSEKEKYLDDKFKTKLKESKEETQIKKSKLENIIVKSNNEKKYPFLLFGIRDFDNYQWISAILRFKNTLDNNQFNKLIDNAPIPDYFKDNNNSKEKMVVVDGQYIDVINWILDAKNIYKIDFAYIKKNDLIDSKYLDWHYKSIDEIKEYFVELSKEKLLNMEFADKRLFKNSLSGIIEYSELKENKIPDQLYSLAYSLKKFKDYFNEYKIDQAFDIYNNYMINDEKYEIFYYFESVDIKDNDKIKKIADFAKTALGSEDFIEENDHDLINLFAYYGVLLNDEELINQIKKYIVEQMNVKEYLYVFNNYMCNLIKSTNKKDSDSEEKFKILIKLFKVILDINNVSKQCLELYTNALYVLQNDNTGLPINEKLNEEFLKKSLSAAKENPAIYYNAGCLYIEMKKYKEAAECFNNAKKYGYDGYDKMLKEIRKHEFYSDFRKSEYYKELDNFKESKKQKQLNEKLIEASIELNFEEIKKMINEGADVNAREFDVSSDTPLSYSSKKDNLQITKFLIESGADVNIICRGETALIRASFNENFDIVKLLVNNNADIQIKNEKGDNAFTTACEKGNYEIAEFLFKKIKLSKKYTNHAFVKACKGNNTKIIKMLYENGADANTKNENGSALMYLAKNDNLEIVKLLIGDGADVNVSEKYGDTALIWASEAGHYEIVEILLKSGADINAIGNGNSTALLEASRKKYIDIIKLLIKNDANVNIKHHLGDDVLSNVLFSEELVKLVIASGADLKNSPALKYAIENDNIEIINFLIENGIDINKESPLAKAVYKNKPELVKMLIKLGADVNQKDKYDESPLHRALEEDKIELVKLLLENGADIEVRNEYGHTPLIDSVKENKTEILELLLKYGADINNTDDRGVSAIFDASGAKICQFLIDNGADIELRDQSGYTPLIWHSLEGNLNVVKTLIENGADIDAVNNRGETALMRAAQGIDPDGCGYYGHYDVVEYLLSKNAKTDIKDKNGKTALDYAKDNEYEKIVDLIENEGDKD